MCLLFGTFGSKVAVPAGDDAYGLVDVVGDMQEVDVGRGDGAGGRGGLAQPLQQTTPVRRADEHQREGGHLAGLHQRHGLEELVQGAEASGQDDEPLGVLHEHGLAGEEVPEVDPKVDIAVQALLERQLDAEPDRRAASLEGTPVGGLHGAGATTGDDGVARLHQRPPYRDTQGVVRVKWLGARGTEHADGRADLGESAESLDELTLNAKYPPWVGPAVSVFGSARTKPLDPNYALGV